MAFTAASWGIWSGVGIALQGLSDLPPVAAAVVKGAVHGVVGGGLSIAQGGGFLEGFAANAIGGAVGVFSDAVSQGGLAADTMIVAAVGGAASVAAGGKFANGALTAAFANLYNKWNAERPSWSNRNNVLESGWGTPLDYSEWQRVRGLDGTGTLVINAHDRIAVEASSVAYPPTNQFWFNVLTRPLDASGAPEAFISTAEWPKPVYYSSGPTGAGRPNAFVLRATPAAPQHRWTISIPPQQAAHGNVVHNRLEIYVPRRY